MCGRFTLMASWQEVVEQLGFVGNIAMPTGTDNLDTPRYNIAPTQDVLVIRPGKQDPQQRRATFMHWGLIPTWADDPAIGNRMINARAESLDKKPAFRDSFARRRCLIPADGFYEWKKLSNRKQPYHIHRADRKPFVFAGLWSWWKPDDQPDAEPVRSFTIVTTEPNELLGELHDRMPAVISRDDVDAWLNNDTPARQLKQMLQPWRDGEWAITPVSTYVNKPEHDDARCVEPVPEDEQPDTLWG